MGFIYLIILGLFVWLDWYLANQFYGVAQMKGYNERKYLWIAFWCTIAGYLLIISLPDCKHSSINTDNEIPDL